MIKSIYAFVYGNPLKVVQIFQDSAGMSPQELAATEGKVDGWNFYFGEVHLDFGNQNFEEKTIFERWEFEFAIIFIHIDKCTNNPEKLIWIDEYTRKQVLIEDILKQEKAKKQSV